MFMLIAQSDCYAPIRDSLVYHTYLIPNHPPEVIFCVS